MKTVLIKISVAVVTAGLMVCTLSAQPSGSELADRLEQKSREWLQNVNTLSITMDTGFGGEVTDVYEKVEEDGHPVLRHVDDDEDFGFAAFAGYDPKVSKAIRGASSITNDAFNDMPVYRVFVDDRELLRSLDDDSFEFDEMEAHTESVTLYFGRDDYYVHGMQMDMTAEDGTPLQMLVTLEDYRTHNGFPVPWVTKINIDGLSDMFSEEDIAQAREGLRELEQQLEGMPESQREMIKEQMGPQIEQLRTMVEAGEIGEMEIRVLDVEVN